MLFIGKELVMFGFGKKMTLRDDLPAIDLRKKQVKGFLGRTKWVQTTKKEQREMKKKLMELYPDRCYLDDLNEWNSIKYDASWIDQIEYWEALMYD